MCGEENSETGRDQRRGRLPHIAGAADAAWRRRLGKLAYDSYGNLRRPPVPMSARQRAAFEERFPGITKIKVI